MDYSIYYFGNEKTSLGKNKLCTEIDFKWNNKLNVINKTFKNAT